MTLAQFALRFEIALIIWQLRASNIKTTPVILLPHGNAPAILL